MPIDQNIKTMLQCFHVDLRKNCPGLKTKIQNKGKTVFKPVNHYARLVKIYQGGGNIDDCLAYAKSVVARYNQAIAKQKQSSKQPAKLFIEK